MPPLRASRGLVGQSSHERRGLVTQIVHADSTLLSPYPHRHALVCKRKAKESMQMLKVTCKDQEGGWFG
jgi:hypothetical protein